VLIAAGAFLCYVSSAHFFGEGRGTVAGAFFGGIVMAVRFSWPLRRQPWFWFVMLLLTALHVAAVAAFDWSAASNWSGLTVMPFMAADTVLALATIYLAYRAICGSPATLFSSPAFRYARGAD
jgi:hypothetical protein